MLISANSAIERPIGEKELLCYCKGHCDSNLVHVLGKEYSWACRAKPGGRCVCFISMSYNYTNHSE